MTSNPDTSNYCNRKLNFENNNCHSNETSKSVISLAKSDTEKDTTLKETEKTIIENLQKQTTIIEACGVHTKNTIKNDLQQPTDMENRNEQLSDTQKELQIVSNVENIYGNKNTFKSNNVGSLNISKMQENVAEAQQSGENKIINLGVSVVPDTLMENELCNTSDPINDSGMSTEAELSPLYEEVSQNISTIQKEFKSDIPSVHSQSSLPDILCTLNKRTTNNKTQDITDLSKTQSANTETERNPVSKSFLCQTSYLTNFLSSEALHNEMEMELKQLQNLHSLEANRSIYKLAYDENVTDQSEADSRSPSPIDPESQVPSSLTNAEIIIHEAESGSDAGSEDVELLPHRYESETFLNENKHVYVNKLSLAVELLRTQESLPYDNEFKRVVGNNAHANDTDGKINHGFLEDSCSSNLHTITNASENKNLVNANKVLNQSQLKQAMCNSNDSAIYSDMVSDNLEDSLCESATEVDARGGDFQDNTEGIRTGYRRFGVQARNYFSPRAALSLNPCFCCTIM